MDFIMRPLPVIIGFGGVNASGRLSNFHGYRRLVIDKLPQATAQSTYRSLASLMGIQDSHLLQSTQDYIKDNTLIRELSGESIETQTYAPIYKNQLDAVTSYIHGPSDNFLSSTQQFGSISNPTEELARKLTLNPNTQLHAQTTTTSKVRCAGSLPTGFTPEALYNSKNHPRGLQLTVYGAADAIHSMGIPWDTIKALVPPDQIAVYAGSTLGQIDNSSFLALAQYPLLGKRITSKQLPLALSHMHADFINSYMIGNIGSTGHVAGACSTFLYNLNSAVADISHGHKRIAIVGTSEAPLVYPVLEGFRSISALAEDQKLCALDNTEHPDYRRASRPFGMNCGFVMSESSTYTIVCDDALALELGAEIYASVGGVFIHADGYKRSITSPGIGNYVSLGKALGLGQAILGDQALHNASYVQAHGTSTPQNRTSESSVLSELAVAFGIPKWPITAVKSYLGHSLSSASGDQLAAVLGAWRDNIIPGITTTSQLADDVQQKNLHFILDHLETDVMKAAFINSKGFGGNNATALILSPEETSQIMQKRNTSKHWSSYLAKNATTKQRIIDRDELSISTPSSIPIYTLQPAETLEKQEISINRETMTISGYDIPINIGVSNPFDPTKN